MRRSLNEEGAYKSDKTENPMGSSCSKSQELE